MNRRKTASVWALVLGGMLLALPAAAQAQKDKPKEAPPDTCAFDCNKKINSQVESCSSACPTPKEPGKQEAALKCMTKCADKFRTAAASCQSSCPTKKAAAPPANP